MSQRSATVTRDTLETQITVSINLDGSGKSSFDTGIPFLEHMLDQIARHGLVDLDIKAQGDRHIDDHHTVEDIGICLGKALAAGLGEKGGIARYGSCYLPMDETLTRVVIDISNRPYLHFTAPVVEQKVGTFDTVLVKEFFRAVSQHGGLTLHIDLVQLIQLAGEQPYLAALRREAHDHARNGIAVAQTAQLWNAAQRPVPGGGLWTAQRLARLQQTAG